MTTILRLISWPMLVMLAINLSRTVFDNRVARLLRLAGLLVLLMAVWKVQS